MECEICGKREAVCLAYLEGAQLNCCGSCAHGSKILYYFDSAESTAPVFSQKPRSEEEIVDGYGKAVKEARLRLGLSIEQLGMKIAEKANYLDHVEREVTLPSLPLARKLEKFLKIRLVETQTIAQQETRTPRGKGELTMLDVAEIERKEDKQSKKK